MSITRFAVVISQLFFILYGAAAAAAEALPKEIKISDPSSVVLIVNRDSNDLAFMDIKKIGRAHV